MCSFYRGWTVEAKSTALQLTDEVVRVNRTTQRRPFYIRSLESDYWRCVHVQSSIPSTETNIGSTKYNSRDSRKEGFLIEDGIGKQNPLFNSLRV